MLLIGSRALAHWNLLPPSRVCKDWDYICTIEELNEWAKENKPDVLYPLSGKKYFAKKGKDIYEFEIAWEGSSGAMLLDDYDAGGIDVYATMYDCYALKMSHRFLKDSPHFLKTMDDILWLRKKFCCPEEDWMKQTRPWYVKRLEETYEKQSHPKLDVKKDEFFKGDGVEYVYQHDTLHEAVKHLEKPAYRYYMKDGEEVLTDKDKFFSVSEETRLLGVLEEVEVLALERYAIPNNFDVDPKRGFDIALSKVCTSITSGWFREFSWNSYHKIQAMYSEDYVTKFHKALEEGIVKKV